MLCDFQKFLDLEIKTYELWQITTFRKEHFGKLFDYSSQSSQLNVFDLVL